MILLNGDCLELMKNLDDNSIDLVFCDLPYGQTSCKWDCKIDLEKFWVEIMRIKKLNTPLFFTTTTKFGVELIQSAPKKCFFRYDLVWIKSAAAGFLTSKKMPMRKHEMIYVFYEKLPFYDLSSHRHKFKESKGTIDGNKVYEGKKVLTREGAGKYDPPLPVSVMKEPQMIKEGQIYNGGNAMPCSDMRDGEGGTHYEPPLPVSVMKEETGGATGKTKDSYNSIYNNSNKDATPIHKHPIQKGNNAVSRYDPPLPVSVVKEVKENGVCKNYNAERLYYYDEDGNKLDGSDGTNTKYDPPLPDSLLEVKSTRGKHSTEKPVALMEWVLKYYSKEGDTILDPTMGSGSTGVACKNLNRNFIGIELNEEIYGVALARLEA